MGNNSILFLLTFWSKICSPIPPSFKKTSWGTLCIQRISALSSGVRYSKLTYYVYTSLEPLFKNINHHQTELPTEEKLRFLHSTLYNV